MNDFEPYGVLGRSGEVKPRAGLWLTVEPDCQNVVRGIVADGWNFDMVLKYSSKCQLEAAQGPWRPVISAREYLRRIDAGTLEHCPQCFIREVFVLREVNLRREN